MTICSDKTPTPRVAASTPSAGHQRRAGRARAGLPAACSPAAGCAGSACSRSHACAASLTGAPSTRCGASPRRTSSSTALRRVACAACMRAACAMTDACNPAGGVKSSSASSAGASACSA
ncbi:hypothetical protein [Cupriavidus sp. D39]|uniref:hypothetical protein n=1 Tax=Cupriavidus sp. D39 TaxID=2997877 RepID=UPI0022719C34|nr:hypothetical protein [Cupriavidus sp. D39]MCY0858313.1 hypothetical protein [Cupriavidus sp. D39]